MKIEFNGTPTSILYGQKEYYKIDKYAFEVRKTPLIILPKNYRILKWLMMAYVRISPEIEIGGLILTDQVETTNVLGIYRGDDHSIRMPRPSFREYKQDLNTFVRFHSHPNNVARFSRLDHDCFQKIIEQAPVNLNQLLHKQGSDRASLSVYDFVITPQGRSDFSGYLLDIQRSRRSPLNNDILR